MGRESLARSTITSNLAWEEFTTMPVDKITAIGLSSAHNEAGSLLLRTDSLDDAALRKLVLILVRRLNHEYRITRGAGRRIAIAVLQEHLMPGCFRCGGTGEITSGLTVVTCEVCGGSKLHRYTDAHRESIVGGAYNKKAYAETLQYVKDALGVMVRNANNRLT